MPLSPWSDRAAAADAVARLATSAADLEAIARAHPDLEVDVASHPNAYPGFLDWLAYHGQPATQDAVRRRRAAAGDESVPPPTGADSPGATPNRPDDFAPSGFAPSESAPLGSAPESAPLGYASESGPLGSVSLRLVSPAARPLVAGSGAVPAPPRPKRGFARVGVVVGVAVVLVAGGVVAFRDELFGGPDEPVASPSAASPSAAAPSSAAPSSAAPPSAPPPSAPPPATPDLIVENAPTLTFSFADGLTELWRLHAAWVDVVDSSVVIVTPFGEDGVHTGLDSGTGEVLWTSDGLNGSGRRLCGPSLWQGQAVCLTVSGGGHPHYLIDAATGRRTELTWLKDRPVQEFFVSGGALHVVQAGRGESGWAGEPLELTRYDSPGKESWTTSFTGLTGLGTVASQVGDLVVVGGPGAHVFDAHDGTLVAGGDECLAPRVFGGNHVTCSGNADDSRRGTVTLSNGAIMTKTFVRGTPVLFEGPERPSAVVVWAEDGGLTRLDPGTGAKIWRNGLDLGPGESVALVIGDGEREEGDEGRIVIVSDHGSRALVDLGTGEVEWQKAEPWEDEADIYVSPEATVLGDGLLWLEVKGIWRGTHGSDQRTKVVSLVTGDDVMEADYAEGQGSDGLFIAKTPSLIDLVRVGPSGSVAPPPKGFPDCPTGLSPIAWTRYADGHGLVCGSAGGDFWAAALHDGEYLTPTKLTFTDGGWTVESDGATSVAVTLDGAVVDVTGPNPGTYGAFGAMFDHTTVDLSGAGEFGPCPAGDRLLSLSTWDDGWLMVCGTAADAPTFAAWGGAEQGEATRVVALAGGYCADGSGFGFEACAYPVNGRVMLRGQGADPVYHRVSHNWFDGVGHGGG